MRLPRASYWIYLLLLCTASYCEGLSRFVPKRPTSLRTTQTLHQSSSASVHHQTPMFTKREFISQAPLILLYWVVFGPLNVLAKTFFNKRNIEQEWLSSALYSEIKGSHCIVTGSNTGIGFETALELAVRGGSVVLACRSREKGEMAAKRINALCKDRGSEGKAMWMALDLSKLTSVVAFCDEYREKVGAIDVLVNNAGVNTKGTTTDGLNESFQINYLGHFLLTKKLLPLLTSVNRSLVSSENHYAKQSRVINLSSVMHHTGGVDFTASAYGKGITSSYDDSKLYMNLLTIELNRRHCNTVVDSNSNRRILAVSVNPGNLKLHSSSCHNSLHFQ